MQLNAKRATEKTTYDVVENDLESGYGVGDVADMLIFGPETVEEAPGDSRDAF